MLETYRLKIEQCEKLKIELDLIHDAITRTKQEIAVLHGKSFNGDEMAKVNGELGAVVGGTEEATQQILAAAEAIDNASTALGKVTSPISTSSCSTTFRTASSRSSRPATSRTSPASASAR